MRSARSSSECCLAVRQRFIALGYDNPAAASASQDNRIITVILLTLFTVVDGYRPARSVARTPTVAMFPTSTTRGSCPSTTKSAYLPTSMDPMMSPQ